MALNSSIYHDSHRWLKINFGKANKCENIECDRQSIKYEWSLIHGKIHEKNRENYRMLCCRCHRLYDHTKEKSENMSIGIRLAKRGFYRTQKGKECIENFRLKVIGSKRTPESKLKMSLAGKRRYANMTEEEKFRLSEIRKRGYKLIRKNEKGQFMPNS